MSASPSTARPCPTIHGLEGATSPSTARSQSTTHVTEGARTIADLLFDDTLNPEETESCLLTFGAKQLRTECHLRQLRIVKKGADCNDHKLGYVALLMQQKRAFAEMQLPVSRMDLRRLKQQLEQSDEAVTA